MNLHIVQLKKCSQLYNQIRTFKFTKSGGLYCASVAEQNYISQNTLSCLVSGSSRPLEKFTQDVEGQNEVKATLSFLAGWFSMPDTGALTHIVAGLSANLAAGGQHPHPACSQLPPASLNVGPGRHVALWVEYSFSEDHPRHPYLRMSLIWR